ncbi:photosynthetic reaction center subunit H [Ideonella sp. A 288]|uniref:photosynthetic reaction center subunit H n=1 Tax=Ideonella sp. A 288 TaxID=1962181 RepID=UPI000B4B3ED6|nr:photosynthetic reaction center subunit H [Ideonella sp. A 288]
MPKGAINSYIDIAQVVLYMFWIFFAGLCYYLHRENKREGYPLESDGRGGRVVIQGFPSVPEPKSFLMRSGEVRYAPGPNTFKEPLPLAEPTSRVPGSPIEPTGNPMLDGVGPGAYTLRSDKPDLTLDDRPRIVPLRVAKDFGVAHQGPDPRGMYVIGADDKIGGTVRDLWVDRSEAIFRYLEVEVDGDPTGRRVLLPMNFARCGDREVFVASILSTQFGAVPQLKSPDEITSLEEDRVMAYYGGGTLYAEPSRLEPLI